MRKILMLAVAAWGAGLSTAAAQAGLPGFEMHSARPVVCPARPENMNTHRAAPDAFLHPAARRGEATQQADITVTYTGFTPQAQAAFQYAVDIWKTLLTSPVPIHVQATWTKLGTNVLGSAGATTVVRNFSGAPQANVWYPIALAEKIAAQDLNGAGQAEISASFSSDSPWYYGTDGNVPAGKYDLTSVVLHELCHGLGFVASTDYDDTNSFGSFGLGGAGAATVPFTFDTFMENAAGQRLVNAAFFTNPSALLGTQLTSGGLYFNSPLAAAVNPTPGDKRPRLYAPPAYSNGSSISHMDENTYPAGTENSLMTYAIGAQESVHDPGPLVRRMFDEMGWFITAIRHAPLRDSETPQNYAVTATVQSDGTVTPGSVKLNYSINNAAFTTVVMTATGVAGQYRGTIPNPGLGATVRYYLSAADNETGRTYTAPGQPAPGLAARATYDFRVGPDVTAPVAFHTPPAYLFANKLPFQLVVQADDNLGVASVSVPYSINGTARPPITLVRQADGITYLGSLGTAGGPIVAGDALSYRVVVTDQSVRANQTTLGPFAVPIVGLKASQNQYVNNFNTLTNDFVGVGFSVTQPAGFTDPAIHSDHPYADAADLTYQLLVPIVVSGSVGGDTLKFDEIALVEPGEDGSTFGSPNFFDYVVVEGSVDGDNWTPLAPGYDARDRPKWLAAYNGALSGGNSTAAGTPALFARRFLNLRTTYAAGTAVQVRFRLFADEAAHGWGWAIDNLSIQRRSAADLLAVGELNVYPNPNPTGQLQVLARLARLTAGLELQVVDVLGRQVMRQVLPGTAGQVDQALDVSGLRPGLYFLRLVAGNEVITRKFVIDK